VASRRKGRILAFQALFGWEANRVPVDELLAFSWLESERRESLDEGMAAFSRALIAGTIENIAAVDGMIKTHLQNWDISRLNRVDLAILRMSAYTLMFQSGIAPSIVIDEAIGIAKEFGSEDSFKFINGVLDSIRRTIQKEPCPSPN
jgi:N utilization substance protein B